MADDRLVVIQTFFDRIEADLAQSALEAAGIESAVQADDSAGMYPQLAMSNGVNLLVREADADRAAEVLTELAETPADDDRS